MGPRNSTFVFCLLCGCSVFDPSLLRVDSGFDAPILDSGTDAPVMDAGVQEALPREQPERPEPGTEAVSIPAFTVALRDVVMNQDGERWRTFGFNLDGVDTQRPELTRECNPPNEASEPLVDGVDGIDNAFGHKLYPLMALALPGIEEAACENHAAGFGTFLFQITDWNGQLNDPQVEVAFTQAAAGTSASPDTVVFADGELVMAADPMLPAPPPAWLSDDSWWSRDDSFDSMQTPLLLDSNGYVRDGYLLMALPERARFVFFINRNQAIVVRLANGHVLIRLGEEGFGRALITGRWALTDFLETAEHVGICEGSRERDLVINQIQAVADVRAVVGSGGPDALCDAFSAAVPFTAFRASHVGMGPSFPIPRPCAR